MRRLGLWWRQPDHYEWLSQYLAVRGLTTATRLMMAVVMVTLTCAATLMMISPTGPHGTGPTLVAALVIGGFAAMAGLWMLRWPTPTQSRLMSLDGTAGISAFCLVVHDPRSAMIGCAAFAGLAGYVAFFHSARYLVLVVGAGMITALVCAVRIAVAGDYAMAAASLLMLGTGVLAVPFAGQILVHWLSVDSRKSSTDALTGLWNRRGFYRAAQRLIAGGDGDRKPCFAVVMIDLDDFKRVNDTLGHPTGDLILVSVAEALREATRGNAVIARVGGEEFLVAETTATARPGDTAERLRAAIASNSWGVTASVGVASVVLSGDRASNAVLAERLVHAADAAMYDAKRAGGNQVRISDTSSV